MSERDYYGLATTLHPITPLLLEFEGVQDFGRLVEVKLKLGKRRVILSFSALPKSILTGDKLYSLPPI